jgi:hypothetical protein
MLQANRPHPEPYVTLAVCGETSPDVGGDEHNNTQIQQPLMA